MAPKATGSSPLARGKPSSATVTQERVRLIPARAGKTDVSTGKQRRYVGSSPLARGKR